MNNVLNYYYRLYPTNIHQKKKSFYFTIENNQYIFTPTELSQKKIQEIYSISNTMLQYQVLAHQIIPNYNNELITIVNGTTYILLRKFQTSQDPINLLDLLKFQNQTSFFINQNEKINWKFLWETKVDYFEYQINQFGKRFPIIRRSSSYYIGLAEMAITLLNFIDLSTANYSIVLSHQRINEKTTYAELFNTLEFVIDSRTRDVSEYLKNKFINNFYIMDEIDNFLNQNLTPDEYLLFFARMLFPSYYFDCFEDILNKTKKEKEILKITEKSKEFEELLVEIYYTIQQYTRIPEIDWFKFYGKL